MAALTEFVVVAGAACEAKWVDGDGDYYVRWGAPRPRRLCVPCHPPTLAPVLIKLHNVAPGSPHPQPQYGPTNPSTPLRPHPISPA